MKAVLKSHNLNDKHARWGSQINGSGIKSVEIVYRAGKDNANADALSRNPFTSSEPTSEMNTDTHN